MYGLLYECKFLTIEETNKKNKKKHGKLKLIIVIVHIIALILFWAAWRLDQFWNQYTVVWWLRTLMRGYSRSEIQMWLPWEILFSSLMDQAIKDKDLTSTVVNVIMTFCLCKSMMKETIQLWRRRWFDTARRYHTIKKKWK